MKYGDILILGIIAAPIYIMLIGWFIGGSRQLRLPLIGVAYLVTVTVAMWGSLALFAAALAVAFY